MEGRRQKNSGVLAWPRICLPRVYPPSRGQHHTAFFGENLTHTPAFNLFMQRWPSDGHVLDAGWAAKALRPVVTMVDSRRSWRLRSNEASFQVFC